MSKLKVAKAIRTTFKVAKWVLISAAIGTVLFLLWLWANASFLSFAIVIGVVSGILLFGGLLSASEWSDKTIKEAEVEERKAQERSRVEKDRLENPDKYVPSFEDDYFDPTDLHALYR